MKRVGGPSESPLERIVNAYGLTLLLVVATYVAASLTLFEGWSAATVAALGCAAGTVGLASAGARPAIVRAAATIGVGSVALAILAKLAGESYFLVAAALVETILLVCAAAVMLRGVIQESEVSFRTILGAVSVYMIIGLLFTSLYAAIDRLQEGPFFGARPESGDFIFFSFTTLTTTGYGNLIPDGQLGRMFAGLEMLIGQIFLVTLIAGLVSLWRPRGRYDRPSSEE